MIRRHTTEYRDVGVALGLAGFSAFSLVYCTQPLLHPFTQEFQVSAAQSALALSLTTGCLACSIFAVSAVSEAFSRKSVMLFSLVGAALLTVLAALAPTWPLLLTLRAVEGLILGGVPAVAMAYLAEEIHPKDLGAAMGLYVGGTAFGGMMGRVGVGLLTEVTSWRVALAIVGAAGLLAGLSFARLLPPPRHVAGRGAVPLAGHVRAWTAHLRTPGLPALFALGFLNLGVMVALFNYLGFRLVAAPYHLSGSVISLIFLVYLLGSLASSLAGSLSDRFGRVPVLHAGLGLSLLGVALTLAAPLGLVILGMAGVTTGFFMTHSVASSSVGQLARAAKGHASALYLLAYYAGSSVVGLAGGWCWARGGWHGVALLCAALLLVGLLVSTGLTTRLRPAQPA